MDAHPSLFESTLASKAQEEGGDEDPMSPSLEYQDLISTLPQDDRWPPSHQMKYQGFWIPDFLMPGVIAAQHRFKARPTDILVATSVKCGTTWLKALTFAAVTRNTYPLSYHPLLHMNPHECFHFVEGMQGQESEVDTLPPPRLLASHLPYSLLPKSVGSSGCRIVYICRDPKDSFVSLWHSLKAIYPDTIEPLPLSNAFDLFCDGVSPYGSFWDHNLGYWNESLRSPDRVLFLKYEEMMDNPAANLKRLAEFLACPFSEEEESRGVVREIGRLCSFEKLSGLEVNKTGSGLKAAGNIKYASFFRRGKVGDWVNHLSPAMATKLDGIIEQKLSGSGLVLTGCSVGNSFN